MENNASGGFVPGLVLCHNRQHMPARWAAPVKSIGKGKARLTAVCSEAGQMHGVVKYWFRIKGKQAIAEQSIAIYGRVTE